MAYTARTDADTKEFFDSPDELQKKIKSLAALVEKSKHLVAYTGAGISTSCGIADFRSGINTVLDIGAGKWAKDAATKEGKTITKKSTKKTSTFKAIPSAAHMALVALQQKGYLKYLVSQNTDGLHRRSGFPPNALAELHGNSTLEICSVCDKVYMRDYRCRNQKSKGSLGKLRYLTQQIEATLKDPLFAKISKEDRDNMETEIKKAYEFIKNAKEKLYLIKQKEMNGTATAGTVKEDMINENKSQRRALERKWKDVLNKGGMKMPRYTHQTGRYCAVKGCIGQLEDTIINFGEGLPEQTLLNAQQQSEMADLYLVLGSSLTVTPAAYMPEKVGMKWETEKEEYPDKEAVHNLVIVNMQKTPHHGICSLALFSKIDDVMVGLMKELDLEIPQWYLERFIKIQIMDVGNRNDQRKLCISGVDRDGIHFSLFKSLIVRHKGKTIKKVIDNKNNVQDEHVYIVPIWKKYQVDDEKKANDFVQFGVEKSKGLTLELAFIGNYQEPKLVVCLNEYVDECMQKGQIVLKMRLDPVSKIWIVPNKSEQLKDKNIETLWSISKNNHHDEEENKNDE